SPREVREHVGGRGGGELLGGEGEVPVLSGTPVVAVHVAVTGAERVAAAVMWWTGPIRPAIRRATGDERRAHHQHHQQRGPSSHRTPLPRQRPDQAPATLGRVASSGTWSAGGR